MICLCFKTTFKHMSKCYASRCRLRMCIPISTYGNMIRYYKYQAVVDLSDYSKEADESEVVNDVITYSSDKRIIFSTYLHGFKMKVPHYVEKSIRARISTDRKNTLYNSSVPLVIEKLINAKGNSVDFVNIDSSSKEHSEPQFPYAQFEEIDINSIKNVEYQDDIHIHQDNNLSIAEDIQDRLNAYNEKSKKGIEFSQVSKSDDQELDFKIYEDKLMSDVSESEAVSEFIGTPNSNIPTSSVPCGGCGAYLHCKDEGIPGYIPSELFRSKSNAELRRLECQRCFFLKKHDTALNVRVTPDVYEKTLLPIRHSESLVIVIVDLLDMPCSVWPGLFDLIGTRRPVVVVGNKLDLLPLDSHKYMDTIKASFMESLKETCLWKTNIRRVCLISAKTGFGVEELISQVQTKWGIKGDIFLVGCTNAGKSSLFNALLASDMCRVAESSLIKRATASPWPGTTLNLLKFPLLKPSGKRLFDRANRLVAEEKKRRQEIIDNPSMNHVKRSPTLSGYIGQTFLKSVTEEDAPENPFDVPFNRIPVDSGGRIGINPESKKYKNYKWCYDTPGTVHPDQFLTLLTHEELVDVLPRQQIVPRTFSLRNSQSLFIGGVARLDLLFCSSLPVKFTVCASSALPITMVPTCDASSFYASYLGSNLLMVPRGSSARMDQWPVLKPTNVALVGRGRGAAADVVLSSAGFIAVTGYQSEDIDLRAWTPGGRGVYARTPSMVPFVQNLIGKRIRKTPTYEIKESKVKE